MISLRPAPERGHANRGWLDSHHSFSFADYHDPEHMGFGPLRVINEDRVQPGKGFGTHGHRDMEIVTYVLAGRLEHKDSMGNGSIIAPGDVQRMSAGTGVTHSEFNPSGSDSVHLLQIWIEPNVKGIPPSYEEARFEQADKVGVLRLIASPDGRKSSVTIRQDAYVYATLLDGAAELAHSVAANRRTYVHVARGKVELNGTLLIAGDAAKLVGETTVTLRNGEQAEVLVFDLP